MDLRVLVVESNPEHLLFLKDVLEELDGSPHWISWTQVVGVYASTWSEAQKVLTEASADVVLLNPMLDDSKGAATFRKCQTLAPQSAVVLVLDDESLPLAEQLLREGVQDYLLHGEIDCAPLARALRNAVDRHRLTAAIRSVAMVDTLTGLLSHNAFLLLAERELRLAQRWGRRATIVVAERLSPDRMGEDLDMRLVKAAERRGPWPDLKIWWGASAGTGWPSQSRIPDRLGPGGELRRRAVSYVWALGPSTRWLPRKFRNCSTAPPGISNPPLPPHRKQKNLRHIAMIRHSEIRRWIQAPFVCNPSVLWTRDTDGGSISVPHRTAWPQGL